MLDTGRYFPLAGSMDAQGAQISRHGQIGHLHPALAFLLHKLKYLDPPLPFLVAVFLLTGDFTCVAAGAIVVINQ